MNQSISVDKVQEFIDREAIKELTYQEEERKFRSLKLSILERAEEQLIKAFKNNDTAMVAAIAEVLKTV